MSLLQVSEVRVIVKQESLKCKRYSSNVWEQHITLVVSYAKMLAKKFGGSEETVELAALLHDLGSMKYGEDNHEITGQKEAERILKKLNYPRKDIDEIKEAIGSHRGSKDIKPKSLTAKILANADAMAHFDVIPVLLRVGLDKYNKDEKLAAKWVLEKLERDWTKKLTIPEAKKMVEGKYQAAKLLLR
ncbi:MAG: HD domain-containing protein [Candidatus Gottesmanbacteria bacterium]